MIIFILMYKMNYCQIKALVVDSVSNKPLKFVNVWVKDRNIGTTTNYEGRFEIKNLKDKVFLTFSKVGYEKKTINIDSINHSIRLKPKILKLEEVTLKLNLKKEILKLGELRKSKINDYFISSNSPMIVARYFKNNFKNSDLRFIKSIKIITKSKIDSAKFNIRLYEGSKNKKPIKYLYNKDIISVAKKGKSYTEIDISDLNVKFPKNGIFVAIEWLLIEENSYDFIFEFKNKSYNKKIFYPKIGVLETNQDNNSWIFTKGKWERIKKNVNGETIYKHIAMELILTN